MIGRVTMVVKFVVMSEVVKGVFGKPHELDKGKGGN